MNNFEKFLGKSWDDYFKNVKNPSECDTEITNTHISKLKFQDLIHYGHFTSSWHQDYYLVVCDICSQVLLPQAFSRHLQKRHKNIQWCDGAVRNVGICDDRIRENTQNYKPNLRHNDDASTSSLPTGRKRNSKKCSSHTKDNDYRPPVARKRERLKADAPNNQIRPGKNISTNSSFQKMENLEPGSLSLNVTFPITEPWLQQRLGVDQHPPSSATGTSNVYSEALESCLSSEGSGSKLPSLKIVLRKVNSPLPPAIASPVITDTTTINYTKSDTIPSPARDVCGFERKTYEVISPLKSVPFTASQTEGNYDFEDGSRAAKPIGRFHSFPHPLVYSFASPDKKYVQQSIGTGEGLNTGLGGSSKTANRSRYERLIEDEEVPLALLLRRPPKTPSLGSVSPPQLATDEQLPCDHHSSSSKHDNNCRKKIKRSKRIKELEKVRMSLEHQINKLKSDLQVEGSSSSSSPSLGQDNSVTSPAPFSNGANFLAASEEGLETLPLSLAVAQSPRLWDSYHDEAVSNTTCDTNADSGITSRTQLPLTSSSIDHSRAHAIREETSSLVNHYGGDDKYSHSSSSGGGGGKGKENFRLIEYQSSRIDDSSMQNVIDLSDDLADHLVSCPEAPEQAQALSTLYTSTVVKIQSPRLHVTRRVPILNTPTVVDKAYFNHTSKRLQALSFDLSSLPIEAHIKAATASNDASMPPSYASSPSELSSHAANIIRSLNVIESKYGGDTTYYHHPRRYSCLSPSLPPSLASATTLSPPYAGSSLDRNSFTTESYDSLDGASSDKDSSSRSSYGQLHGQQTSYDPSSPNRCGHARNMLPPNHPSLPFLSRLKKHPDRHLPTDLACFAPFQHSYFDGGIEVKSDTNRLDLVDHQVPTALHLDKLSESFNSLSRLPPYNNHHHRSSNSLRPRGQPNILNEVPANSSPLTVIADRANSSPTLSYLSNSMCKSENGGPPPFYPHLYSNHKTNNEHHHYGRYHGGGGLDRKLAQKRQKSVHEMALFQKILELNSLAVESHHHVALEKEPCFNTNIIGGNHPPIGFSALSPSYKT